MRIGGIDPRTLPNEEVLVLPRGDQQIVFRARGLANMDEFDAMCTEPKVPVRMTPDGIVENRNEPNYKSVMLEYAKRRIAYIIVKSLEPSQIEWETVDMSVPGSFANWESDLLNAGLNKFECNRVLNLCFEANSLDEGKIKKAREVFLQGLPQESAT